MRVIRKKLVGHSALAVSAAASLLFLNCGDGGGNQQSGTGPVPPPSDAYQPTAAPYGGFKVGCGPKQNQQQQSQQIQYQQQSAAPDCSPQLQFFSSKISDFDLRMDCDAGVVNVANLGSDQKKGAFPIQDDGTVRGQLEFQQQIQNDGQGNVSCWVKTVIDFDGRANCRDHDLELTSHAQFASTSEQEVPNLRDYEVPVPGETLIPLPSISPLPIPSVTSPTSLPETSPTPTQSPGLPTPSASPSTACSTLPVSSPVAGTTTIHIAPGAASQPCYAFGSVTPSVLAGARVTWVNDDSVPHEIISDTGAWDSGMIDPGQSFTTTVQGEGSYPYHCQDNPRIQGALMVMAGARPSEAPLPAPSETSDPGSYLPPPEFPDPSHSSELPPPNPAPRPPNVRQITVCVVKNPCPVIGKGKLSCP